MPQIVAKSMTKTTSLSSNSFQPGGYFSSATRDHLSTRGCLTGPRNKPQEKKTEEQ